MSYRLNVPTIKLYGASLKVVDYTSTTRGYDVTVRIDEHLYQRAGKLSRLDLRMPHDDRIFKAAQIGDIDISKRGTDEPADVIIEFIGKTFVPEKGEVL